MNQVLDVECKTTRIRHIREMAGRAMLAKLP